MPTIEWDQEEIDEILDDIASDYPVYKRMCDVVTSKKLKSKIVKLLVFMESYYKNPNPYYWTNKRLLLEECDNK